VRIAGLDHVQLAAPAGCEAAARAFFCDLLGLEELEKPEALRPRGGVWFGLPDGASSTSASPSRSRRRRRRTRRSASRATTS
jgi:catechol 2,3-dioxygenase-like lactoylglutathione lyase family enzyme